MSKDNGLITVINDNPDTIFPEAFFHFNENDLIVHFGQNRSATMSLANKEEKKVVEYFLSDPNLWANFFGSLSAALKENM